MKYSITIILVLFSLVHLTSCKKGDNDPLISMRTRMNRITGHWKMTERIINSKETFQYLDAYSQTPQTIVTEYTSIFNGHFITVNYVNNNSSNITPYSCDLEIKKDFTYSIIENNFINQTDQKWYWLSENKKKTSILLSLESGLIPSNNFLDDQNYFEIDRLTNKALILKISFDEDVDHPYSSGTSHLKYDYEATFEKKQ